MSERLLYLYCRVRAEVVGLGERIRALTTEEAGLSKIATTVILVAAAVGIALAVIGILGPKIIGLARRAGKGIDSVPLEWGK